MKTKPFRIGATVMLVAIVTAALGCAGGSQSVPALAPPPAGPPPSPSALSISPETDILGPGGTRVFTSTTAVTWTLAEGAAGGMITNDGAYTAPSTLGTDHVVATSVADPSKTATGTVQVVKSGFTVAGATQKDRVGHTATVLSDGKVLIVGGGLGDWWDGFVPISEAELFDPSTGTSTITGTTTRIWATATLLANGKVLLTGGEHGFTSDPSSVVAESAEIYDPATGQFQPVDNMGTKRELHAATLLANGRVLVTGGIISWPSLSSAEIYDPATGTFTSTGSMTTRRDSHSSILLTNGKVLVAGGNDYEASGSTASAELYDPATGLFTPTGSMSEPRAMYTATLLPDGSVLVTGGALKGGTAEVYDPSTGKFSPVGPMNVPRTSGHIATLLPDGTALIAGGATGNGATYTAEIYNPATKSFTPTGSLAESRSGHTATALADGRVLLLGGGTNSAEVYK